MENVRKLYAFCHKTKFIKSNVIIIYRESYENRLDLTCHMYEERYNGGLRNVT